jgi:hypothetical protein
MAFHPAIKMHRATAPVGMDHHPATVAIIRCIQARTQEEDQVVAIKWACIRMLPPTGEAHTRTEDLRTGMVAIPATRREEEEAPLAGFIRGSSSE